MRFHFRRETETYFCVGCHATGRLPVVIGEGFCSYCGELVWTVKPQIDQSEFGPDYRLPIRSCRLPPRLKTRWFARLCVRFFPSIVRRTLYLREQRAMAEINEKLEQLRNCEHRHEYQRLLGRPKDLFSGKGFATLRNGRFDDSPDVIEHFEVANSCFDLYFTDNRLQSYCAYEKLTVFGIEFNLAMDSWWQSEEKRNDAPGGPNDAVF